MPGITKYHLYVNRNDSEGYVEYPDFIRALDGIQKDDDAVSKRVRQIERSCFLDGNNWSFQLKKVTTQTIDFS